MATIIPGIAELPFLVLAVLLLASAVATVWWLLRQVGRAVRALREELRESDAGRDGGSAL